MKSCPVCQRTYPDETLIYCLDDGSVLRPQYKPEATLVSPYHAATKPVQSQTLPLNWSQVPPPQRNSRWLMYSLIALVLVAIGGGLVIWLQSGKTEPRGLSAPPTEPTSSTPNQPEVARNNENKQDTESRNSSTPHVSGGDNGDPSTEKIPTAQQLVGAWRGKVSELGETFDVTFTANADGTYQYFARNRRGQTSKQHGTWQYTGGTLYQTFSNGASGKASVEWIDSDTFELTIIDNGVPAYNGLKRRYHRAG